MPTLAAPLDCSKLEVRQQRIHQLGTAPSSPVTGQMYYNTGDNTFYWWDNSAWVSARGGASATPPATNSALGTIQLAGDLGGNNTATAPALTNLCVTDAKVAAANKDGAAGTYSMRTIGTGALQAMAGNTRLDTIAAPTGTVAMNAQRIVNLAEPSSSSDAATRNYVDNVAQGLDAKQSVQAATTGSNITLAGGAPDVLDGITLLINDRVLVKDQTTPAQNGIYTVQAPGTGSTGTWARATDQDAWSEVPSAYVWVEKGGTLSDTGWVCTADSGGTLGTTPITWTQFSGAASITAGAGLTKTGNTIDVIGTTNRISVAADSIDISTSYVGQTSITTLGTIATGVWSSAATPIAITSGGTGGITAGGARVALGCTTYYSTATHGAGTTISIASLTHQSTQRGTIVQCQVDATGAIILPDITVASNGDVLITFSASQSANTIRTTIIGLTTAGQPA